MKLKSIIEEDFTNYKLPCMVLGFPHCTFKCEKESGICCCQNSSLAKSSDREFSNEYIIHRYINNPITSAIVCAGLEPFDDWEDLLQLLKSLREYTEDNFVIYTGYYPEEIAHKIDILKSYKNVIIKFGRFIPNQEKHFDEIIGVELASLNQYAKKIS